MMQGSFQNRIMEQGVRGQPAPVVGMGVTEFLYTDRHPWQIVRIEGNRVYIKPCGHIHGPGGYGKAGEVRESADETVIRQNRKGQWCIVEKKYRNNGTTYMGISSRIVRLEAEGPGQFYEDPGF